MRLEDLNEMLGRLLDWIDNADTKTSVLIAILTLLLAFTPPEIKDTRAVLHTTGSIALKVAFLGLWLVYVYYFFISFYHALHVLSPHPKSLQYIAFEGQPAVTDFISFGTKSLDEYTAAINNTDEESLRQELIRACYAYGLLANHKFQHYMQALFEFRIALLAQIALFAWISIALPGGV